MYELETQRKYDVAGLDSWRTVLNCKYSPFEVISGIIGKSQREVINGIQGSPIFTSEGDIENMLRDHFSTESRANVDSIVEIWKRAPSESYVMKNRIGLVESFHSEGIPLVLISNVDGHTFENLPSDVKKFLDKYFSGFYLSYQLGMCKPDKRIFEKVRADYQTQFKRMHYCGDDHEFDEKPAIELGIDFVLVEKGAA